MRGPLKITEDKVTFDRRWNRWVVQGGLFTLTLFLIPGLWSPMPEVAWMSVAGLLVVVPYLVTTRSLYRIEADAYGIRAHRQWRSNLRLAWHEIAGFELVPKRSIAATRMSALAYVLSDGHVKAVGEIAQYGPPDKATELAPLVMALEGMRRQSLTRTDRRTSHGVTDQGGARARLEGSP